MTDPLEGLDETPVPRIRTAADRLKPSRAVDVCDGGHHASFVGPNWINLQHEWIGDSADEVLVQRLLRDRRCKRTEPLAKLDAGVDDLTHIRSPRVGDDAAIAECARAPFHASLKPADDSAG